MLLGGACSNRWFSTPHMFSRTSMKYMCALYIDIDSAFRVEESKYVKDWSLRSEMALSSASLERRDRVMARPLEAAKSLAASLKTLVGRSWIEQSTGKPV
jgi:hypothetical protein